MSRVGCGQSRKAATSHRNPKVGDAREGRIDAWLTGFPRFLSLVNQRGCSVRENTECLLAQVDAEREKLSTKRKWLAGRDLGPRIASERRIRCQPEIGVQGSGFRGRQSEVGRDAGTWRL